MTNEIKEIFELYEKQANNPNLSILIKTLKEWYFEKEDYKSRCEKAIEYIKNKQELNKMFGTITLSRDSQNELLNILGGDDNE